MIKKQYVKSRKVYKVTFSMPKKEQPEGVDVKTVHLVGNFNTWSNTKNPMKPNSKGVFKTTLEFKPGQELQFRYFVNQEFWANEWSAEEYQPNEFGGDNCILHLPAV